MDTSKLKKFAQFARRTLITQVGAKLEAVVADNSSARREHPDAMRKLEAAIAKDGKDQVIERVAYTWFNRFSALRFMDMNELSPVRVVSPVAGQFQPEILAEAKAGHMDEGRVPDRIREQVRSLLDGRTPSADAQTEAYRLLIVAICNDLHKGMPFLFERIDDYTELLLPDDLLSNASILAYVREAMTPDVCEDVEVIGWLYQFYISEKKDEVFAGLKKNKKITAENIPAATQLFTPHWIVRYLVENSLGRLWLLNRPGSKLAAKMDLYEETVVKNTFCVSFPVRLPAPLPPYSDPIDWLRSFRGQLMHNPCIDLYPVEAEAAYHNPYSHPRIEQRRMRTKLLLGVSRRHQSSRSRIAPTRVALLSLLQHRHQTARSSAPCGTSPVSTKRQSAISNFRASATIPTLAARPPFPLKRLRYQTANSLLG